MTARSPSAYVVSMVLHGMFVAVLIATAIAMREDETQATKEFELVMGDGTNYAATIAPQEGRPEGSNKIELAPASSPKVPPRPSPPQPEPTPEEPTFVEPKPSPLPTKPTPKKPEPAPLPTKTPDTPKPTQSFEEWRKLHPEKPTNASSPKATGPIVKTLNPKEFRIGVNNGAKANNGITTPGAGGKALTTEEGNLLEKYFQMLRNAARQNHKSPPGAAEGLEAEVQYTVAPNGAISAVRIVRSSGNADFDRSAVEAFRTLDSVGAVPDGHTYTRQTTITARN